MHQEIIALDKSIAGHSSKKFRCPNCGQKRYVRYYNFTRGEYLSEEYGRCDRQDSCQYHNTPYKDLKNDEKPYIRITMQQPSKPTSFIDDDTFSKSLDRYEQNNLVQFLRSKIDHSEVLRLVGSYSLGTCNYTFRHSDHAGYVSSKGATVFWQVDRTGKVRSGKVILYDAKTGKRVKAPFPHITWVHKILKVQDYNLKQCFFGEHLLKQYPDKPIAIVESEKTAMICSLYFPKYIWVACGAKDQLNSERIAPLFGRNVTLFPDLNAYKDWQKKANDLSHITDITVSDLLEQIATDEEREQGLDLADYCLRTPYKRFRLRSEFKEQILNNSYSEEEQMNVARQYMQKGLLPIDVKRVAEELINEYGFIAA